MLEERGNGENDSLKKDAIHLFTKEELIGLDGGCGSQVVIEKLAM